MRKLKYTLPVVFLAYLAVGAWFFIPKNSADEMLEPTQPTIVGWSYSIAVPGEKIPFYAGLYNPPVDEAVNPNVGKKICSVETSLTFPKDILEVASVSFAQNAANNYSNETGTLNFRALLNPCTTITGIDLFDVEFAAKQVGEGAIVFTKSIVVGDEDGQTTIPSGIYENVPVSIVLADEYRDPGPIEDPLPEPPGGVPPPVIQPIVTPPRKVTPTPSQKPTTTSAPKPGEGTGKTPSITKVEFGQNAVLDKQLRKTKGAVFSGTGEPGSKIHILINSETILDYANSGVDGTWTYSIGSWIQDGGHQITVWSEKDGKLSEKISSKFVISSYAKNQIALGDKYPDAPSGITTGEFNPPQKPSDNPTKNKYLIGYICLGVAILIVSVVLITKKRKDQRVGIHPENNIPHSIGSDNPFYDNGLLPPRNDNQNSTQSLTIDNVKKDDSDSDFGQRGGSSF